MKHVAVADYAANRMQYYSFLNGPNAACTQCAKDPSHTTFFFATTGSYNPGNGGPDGIHYDVQGNLWAPLGIGGVIEYDPRGIILGYVPMPNGDRQPPTSPSEAKTTSTSTWKAQSADRLPLQGPLSGADRTRRRAEQGEPARCRSLNRRPRRPRRQMKSDAEDFAHEPAQGRARDARCEGRSIATL